MPSPRVSEATVGQIMRQARMKFEPAAKEDVMNALNSFKDLQPVLVNHKFPDNVTRACLALDGTIPMVYKGQTYHIPVKLFLLDNHPYSGPYCYVTPTANMQVRPTSAVDNQGRIYLPYLTEWRYPGYDTTGLLQVMTIAFQEKCPVFSTVGQSNNPVAATPQPQPQPPYPLNPPMGMPMPNAGPTSAYQPPYPTYPSHPTPNNIPTTNTGTIQQSHIRASLVSAVEDRIRQRLTDKIGTPFAELQSVNENLQELRSGQQRLRDILERMDKDQREVDTALRIYKDKKVELQKALESCGKANGVGGNNNIEDSIDATTPVHRQILRCYVEDCVIDDTIYFLGQALKKGTINLQTYLKYVRQLSRRQFISRATMQKCRQKANLPV